jgi:hypothetical protein
MITLAIDTRCGDSFVIGATTLIRPSTAPPLEIEPPTPTPMRCQSPGCRYWAHSALSVGGGTHCCEKCKEHPCKYSARCEKLDSSGPPPKWARAVHGCVDLELTISLKLPIPTFLIPLAFVRWVLVKLVKLIYPYLIALNERFGTTPFAERVAADADGFYARLRSTTLDAQRPHRTAPGAAAPFVLG